MVKKNFFYAIHSKLVTVFEKTMLMEIFFVALAKTDQFLRNKDRKTTQYVCFFVTENRKAARSF